MQTTPGAILRPLLTFTHCLCALTLFVLAAPLCAADTVTAPTIANATIGPNLLPVIGGVITVSATVTDSTAPVSSVMATISRNSAYYDPSDDRRTDTIPLYLTTGNVYTGTIPSSGNNTSNVAYTYTATVTATADTLSNTINAGGATVQADDNMAPSIASASVSPTTLLVTGGVITVTATVTDPNQRAITSVQATVSRGGAYYDPSDDRRNDTITLYNSSGSNVYVGSIPSSGNNTDSASAVYTATVTATNDLGFTQTVNAAGQVTQPNDSTPPTISNATVVTKTLPVDGGGITISATVTDPNQRPITTVQATVVLNGAAYTRTDDRFAADTVTLSNSGNGVYTGTIPSAAANTSNAAYSYTAMVTATNALNLSSSASATGQAVQAYDNTPSVITNTSIGPSALAYSGGAIRVTATVSDPGKRVIKSVQATVSLNGAAYTRSDDRFASDTITLSNSGNGVYTGTIPSAGPNTDSFNYNYTATVTAINDLNFTSTAAVTGQTAQASSGPPAGSIPILYTIDETTPVLVPTSVAVGSPDLTLTVHGSNFASGAMVLFNGVTLKPSRISLTRVIVTVPAFLLTEAGSDAVSVVNVSPGGTSNSVNFNVH